MFSNFKAAQPKTVESVLSQFNQVCKDLEEIHEREIEVSRQADAEIARLESQKQAAVEEANRALHTASKIRSMITM
jgi:hypothetical protein